jgi:hypothetical protein
MRASRGEDAKWLQNEEGKQGEPLRSQSSQSITHSVKRPITGIAQQAPSGDGRAAAAHASTFAAHPCTSKQPLVHP